MKKNAKIYPEIPDENLSIFRASPLTWFRPSPRQTPDLPSAYDILGTEDHLDMQATPTSIAVMSPTPSMGLLIKNEDNQWRIKLDDDHFALPFEGPYDFVKTRAGEIRVRHNAEQAHIDAEIIYAGQLYFSDDGLATILQWNNKSDDTPKGLINAEEVGLPMPLFQSVETRYALKRSV